VPRRRKLGVIVPGTDANLRLEVCSGLLAARRDNGGVLEGEAKWAADGRGACQNTYSALQEWPSPVHREEAISADIARRVTVELSRCVTNAK